MTDPLATFARNKLICTGVALDYEAPVDPNPLPATGADFDAMVTRYYKLLRERIGADVAFLRAVYNAPGVARFDKTVYQLRTAKQHYDNFEAKRFYARWTSGRSWEAASEAFLREAASAWSELELISSMVRRDAKLAKAWKDHAAVELETIFEAVCRDLDARFGRNYRKRLLRNINHRRQRLPLGLDVKVAVEQLCVQEICTAEQLTLPVPHYQILDRLGLLGRAKARAALLLAYSVHAVTDLTGEDFLERVEETWRVASSCQQ